MRFSGFRKIVSVVFFLTVVCSLFSFAQNGKTVFKYKTCDGKPLTDMEYHSEYSESYNSKTGYYTLTVNKVITTLEYNDESLPYDIRKAMGKNVSEIVIPKGIKRINNLFDSSPVLYYNRGEAYVRLKNYSSAAREYKKAKKKGYALADLAIERLKVLRKQSR